MYYVGGEVCRSGKSVHEERVGAQGYRLPREAEWEWAARGGVKGRGCRYSGSNDLGEVGWYDENSGGKTHEVGTKLANELGIFDMSGNVWEWCFDAKWGMSRVLRGGRWSGIEYFARVSYRGISDPSDSYDSYGFRVVRSSVS